MVMQAMLLLLINKLMKKYYILLLLNFLPIFLIAQKIYVPGVGINTDNPKRTLDVNGEIISTGESDKWFFENPGKSGSSTSNSYLTVIDKDENRLKAFDPVSMSYGAINYVIFRFNKLPSTGLEAYNTKISAKDYHVVIGGFIIYGGNTLDSSGLATSTATTIDKNVLYNSRAYVNENNEWILTFKPNNSAEFSQNRVDIVLNVTIYRKNLLLLDSNEIITYDMNSNPSDRELGKGTAPKPVGIN